ncbi:MAG: HicB family protein [Candidatus Vogelbacteria bacterium CG10_big_fil_rev_8_21_14_0_10_51_16]|uniref:HicB family protein n=1 Tax=Candidatus Vogelbacteria bacterium CG10_big_fil_rev_8_21_14_0_10_51_16 TaxID=1975045 RepID=A0A2H0RD52_9BACT|nr:MAG: HicB family protein [Candidatus Vogelbacteria bacterium CG10_big_fil_rev_8_21_14_0_10_51_16]
MNRFTIELEREQDGRWIAEIIELPGVVTYGETKEEATAKVEALALRVLADRLESEEMEEPALTSVAFSFA